MSNQASLLRGFDGSANFRRGPDFQSRPGRGKGEAGMKHHFDRGAENEFVDPAVWNRASYTPDLLAELGEPLPDAANDYRAAALYFCRIMYAVDEFAAESIDTRLAICLNRGRPGLAIDPRLEYLQHRLQARVHAGDVDPFNCPIQGVDGRP
jgi:hypothetical protein